MKKSILSVVISIGLSSCIFSDKKEERRPIAVPMKKDSSSTKRPDIKVAEKDEKRRIEVKAGEQYVKPPKLDSIAAH